MASKQGKAVSDEKRKLIINLFMQGHSYKEISKQTCVSTTGCFNIVKHFEENKQVGPKLERSSAQRPRKVTSDVLRFIEYCKWKKPSIYSSEIRQKLLDENVCSVDNVPSSKRISYVLKNVLNFSYKKLTTIPAETLRPGHDGLVNAFFASLLGYNYMQLHFFDEASIITTSGNRHYGHAPVGERAVEFQRYASSATLTINVCCNFFGIDYYSVINGASNAFEMINFFAEALEEKNEIGNPMFTRGDVVIMDNCGFHHHRQGERLLRDLLRNYGVDLVFQPPYCPEFNVTECVFGVMRQRLQANESFASQFPELAVVNSLDNTIMKNYMPSFFKRCGYK